MEDLSLEKLIKYKLLELLKTIESNRLSYLEDTYDDEYLHQIRVAIRKIRAICFYFQNHFINNHANKCKTSLSFIAKFTNEARDLDVYIKQLDQYKSILPKKTSLDIFEQSLQKEKINQIKKLKTFFKSEKYLNTILRFKSKLKSDKLIKKETTYLNENIKSSILKTYNNIIKKGLKLQIKSEDKKFHKTRLEFKKIRYLIEFLEPIYKKNDYAKIISRLKKVQTLLGDFNDYGIEQKRLQQYKKELKLPKDEKLYIDIIIDHLKNKQLHLKIKFHKIFIEFIDGDFKKLILNF